MHWLPASRQEGLLAVRRRSSSPSSISGTVAVCSIDGAPVRAVPAVLPREYGSNSYLLTVAALGERVFVVLTFGARIWPLSRSHWDERLAAANSRAGSG